MSDARGAMLVDEMSGIETIERKGSIEGMRLVVGHRVKAKTLPEPGVALNPPVPQPQLSKARLTLVLPSMIGQASGVVSTMPPHWRLSRNAPREHREELDDCRRRVLNHVRAASLRVTIVVIDAGADDEFALVGLARSSRGSAFDMTTVSSTGFIDARTRTPASGWLSIGMRMPAMRARTDGMAGGHAADALGANVAPARLEPLDAAIADIEAGHLAVLDDVDAELARPARKSPGHSVVARDAAARLKARAKDRIALVGRNIDQGMRRFTS